MATLTDQVRARLAALRDQAVATYHSVVERAVQSGGPLLDDLKKTVTQFAAYLEEARLGLGRSREQLAKLPDAERAPYRDRLALLEAKQAQLSEPFWSDVPGDQVGVAPLVVLAVVGIGSVGASAVSWAVAYWEEARSHRDEVALAERELVERVAASKEGRTLQQTTLPDLPSQRPPKGQGGGGGVALALLAVAGGTGAVLLLPKVLKKR